MNASELIWLGQCDRCRQSGRLYIFDKNFYCPKCFALEMDKLTGKSPALAGRTPIDRQAAIVTAPEPKHWWKYGQVPGLAKNNS